MLFDLLSTDMYVSYNTKLAHIIGLKEAIYVSELININRKALIKDKLYGDFFIVDRSYIEKRTTLKATEQLDIEERLKKIALIEGSNEDSDKIRVNMDTLVGLMLNDKKMVVADISKIVKEKKKPKKESIKDNLKLNLGCITNEELKSAYSSWIDSVYDRQGWMSKETVFDAINKIDKFTNYDLDVALEVLRIASINGWREINWAINKFKESHPNFVSITNTQHEETQELSNEVF